MYGIGKEYNDLRSAVKALHNEYSKVATDESGINSEYLSERMSSINAERFEIAVVGEVKAGKSTLINSLLNEKILPSDVLQSSSAIISIKKSIKMHVNVKYADGMDKTYYEETAQDINLFLRSLAAVEDRYRDIPVNQLDGIVIESNGSVTQLTSEDIKALGANSKMDLEGKEVAILDYLETRKLGDIPVEITVGYPFEFEFDDLVIVDSPGVNAVGGIQDTTFNYLNRADAVLFVHSLNAPIDLESLRRFVKEAVRDRNKDSLFLVLSHAGAVPPRERVDKFNDAKRIYSKDISPDNIVSVDSIAPRILSDLRCADAKGIAHLSKSYKNQMKMAEMNYDKTGDRFYNDESIEYYTRRQLILGVVDECVDEDDVGEVVEKLKEIGRFEELTSLVNSAASAGPMNLLKSVTDTIVDGLQVQQTQLSGEVEFFKIKQKDPVEFEIKIRNAIENIEEFEADFNEFLHDGKRSQKGNRDDIALLEIQYLNKVKESVTEKEVGKRRVDFFDAAEELMSKRAEELKGVCESHIEDMIAGQDVMFQSVLPRQDFSALLSAATKKATQKEKVETSKSIKNRGENTGVGIFLGALGGLALGIATVATGGMAGAVAAVAAGGVAGGVAGDQLSDDDYEEIDKVDGAARLSGLKERINKEITNICRKNMESDLCHNPITIGQLLGNMVIEFVALVEHDLTEKVNYQKNVITELQRQQMDNNQLQIKLASLEENIKATELVFNQGSNIKAQF